MTSIVSRAWAGWFTDVQAAIAALDAHYAVTPTVQAPPLQQHLLKEDGTVSERWGLGYFQPVKLAIDAIFVAAALPNILPPPQLAVPMQYTPTALRLPWIGWFTAVRDAIELLNDTAMLASTFSDPPLGSILLNQN